MNEAQLRMIETKVEIDTPSVSKTKPVFGLISLLVPFAATVIVIATFVVSVLFFDIDGLELMCGLFLAILFYAITSILGFVFAIVSFIRKEVGVLLPIFDLLLNAPILLLLGYSFIDVISG